MYGDNITEECKENIIKAFDNCIYNMRAYDINFPKYFMLHYVLKEHSDRDGRYLSIKPFISEEMAHDNCDSGESENPEGGKYWWNRYETVVNGYDKEIKYPKKSDADSDIEETDHEITYKLLF